MALSLECNHLQRHLAVHSDLPDGQRPANLVNGVYEASEDTKRESMSDHYQAGQLRFIMQTAARDELVLGRMSVLCIGIGEAQYIPYRRALESFISACTASAVEGSRMRRRPDDVLRWRGAAQAALDAERMRSRQI